MPAFTSDVTELAAKSLKGHRSEIMKKLKLGSLAELIRYAIRNEIVQP